MNLLFESTFDEMNAVSYEQIKFLYWNYELPVSETTLDPDKKVENLDDEEEAVEENLPEPNIRIFDDFNEKQYFIQIASLFVRYFKKQHGGLLEEDKENYESFLMLGYDEKASRNTTDYRSAISKALFKDNKYKPLNFDYLLIKQLFVTSMMPTDPIISISLGDIVHIYNTLVANKEMRWIETSNRDFKEPISLLRKELGDKPINLGSAHERMMNLRIKVRFLATHSKLIRCRACSAPVIDTMVPDFEKKYAGGVWNCTCKQSNSSDRSRC